VNAASPGPETLEMSNFSRKRVDVAGIGFGPANIALAIALREEGIGATARFFEKMPAPNWQPEMMVAGADIQHNPLRDFVTPRNPTSPYGFLSYLQAENRLWDYLNLSAHYPPRSEYAEYIKWVARKFDGQITYGQGVSEIRLTQVNGTPQVLLTFEDGQEVEASAVSIGCGRSLYVPALFAPVLGPPVVGASQSAAEVTLDLLSRPESFDVFNVTSGVGYRQKDLSPFTEQIYYPEYVDYFFRASDRDKKRLISELRNSNYSAADSDVIERLNLFLYEQKFNGRERLNILNNTTICGTKAAPDGGITLDVIHRFRPERSSLNVDGVLLATGFRNLGGGEREEKHPPLLNSIADAVKRRADGSVYVTRDYRLMPRSASDALPPIYLNGLCESTHGFGDAGSFSLLALRSSTIARSIGAALFESNLEDVSGQDVEDVSAFHDGYRTGGLADVRTAI
jgi:L-ornithine N5-oxygenase